MSLSLMACGAKTGLRVPRLDASPELDVQGFDAVDVVDVRDVATPISDVQPTYLGTEFYAVSTTNSNLP